MLFVFLKLFLSFCFPQIIPFSFSTLSYQRLAIIVVIFSPKTAVRSTRTSRFYSLVKIEKSIHRKNRNYSATSIQKSMYRARINIAEQFILPAQLRATILKIHFASLQHNQESISPKGTFATQGLEIVSLIEKHRGEMHSWL